MPPGDVGESAEQALEARQRSISIHKTNSRDIIRTGRSVLARATWPLGAYLGKT